MPTKFKNGGKTAKFQVRSPRGGYHFETFHGLDIYIPTDGDYRSYTPRSVAFATMLDWFWRQNCGVGWSWRDSINSVGASYMRGVNYPDQERTTYTKAKEIIREGYFGLEFEGRNIVYAYATSRGPKALSGYVDKAFTAVVYDEQSRRMERLMSNRVTTGTVEPAAAGFGTRTRIVRPTVKTLKP